MQVIIKIVLVVGILGAIAAVEGLNRFGGLVSAFGGGDPPKSSATFLHLTGRWNRGGDASTAYGEFYPVKQTTSLPQTPSNKT